MLLQVYFKEVVALTWRQAEESPVNDFGAWPLATGQVLGAPYVAIKITLAGGKVPVSQVYKVEPVLPLMGLQSCGYVDASGEVEGVPLHCASENRLMVFVAHDTWPHEVATPALSVDSGPQAVEK